MIKCFLFELKKTINTIEIAVSAIYKAFCDTANTFSERIIPVIPNNKVGKNWAKALITARKKLLLYCWVDSVRYEISPTPAGINKLATKPFSTVSVACRNVVELSNCHFRASKYQFTRVSRKTAKIKQTLVNDQFTGEKIRGTADIFKYAITNKPTIIAYFKGFSISLYIVKIDFIEKRLCHIRY